MSHLINLLTFGNASDDFALVEKLLSLKFFWEINDK